MTGPLRLASLFLLIPMLAMGQEPIPTPALAPFAGNVARRVDLIADGKPDSFAVYEGTKLLVLYGQANRLISVDTEAGKVEDRGPLVPRVAAGDRGWFPSAVSAPDGTFYLLRGRVPEFEVHTWAPGSGLVLFGTSEASRGGGGAGELYGLAIAPDGTLTSMANNQVRVWNRDTRTGRTIPTQTIGMNSIVLGSCQPMSAKGGWVTGFIREQLPVGDAVSDGVGMVGWMDFNSNQITPTFTRRTVAGRMPSLSVTREGLYIVVNNDAAKGESVLYKLDKEGADAGMTALPKTWLDPKISVRGDGSATLLTQSTVARPVDPYAKDPLTRPTKNALTDFDGRMVLLDRDLLPLSVWKDAVATPENPYAVGDPIQATFLENGKAVILDRARRQVVVIE